ncbi:hypothetical protein C5E45_23870 [Nocardia nova]|uniref:PrgI family protein n=1 Tax=Nocardia nova TaxID=37330 RepID=A0A2S6AKT4_9NOCA|nr:SCO6880 family protein [Nocardia nova]PPJ35845.1 hypothetical protein C5E45_23870 [Nocardia nova]
MSVVDSERTYSAGSRPRNEGLFGLSWVAMITVGAVVIAVVLAQAMLGFIAAATVLGIGAFFALPLVVTIGGRTGWVRAILLWQWWRGARRGEHTYRSGSFSAIPGGAQQLPGVLAPTRMYSARTSDGHWFAMIHMPKTSGYTVVLKTWPQGSEAVDQDLVDQWVAGWGSFLATYGGQPDITSIAAVIDTVPETGNRLMGEVSTITRPDAPHITQQVMWELGSQLARQRVQMEARLAITFEATTPERRKVPAEQALEIGRRLPGIVAALAEAGLRARPMTAEEVIAVVRRSYDPSTQADFEASAASGGGHGVTWEQAGPNGQRELWDRLVHCGATSVTWEMVSPPKGTFHERVLQPLLEPNLEVPRKRVTIIYRPHAAAEATSIVDSDYRNAVVAEQNTRGGLVSAAARIRAQTAHQAREEVARGHGLSRYGALLTITAPRGHDIPRIDAVIKDLSSQARLQITRSYGYQAAVFAAGLGVGVILPEHSTVPELLEDS